MLTYQESEETSFTRGNVDKFLEETKKEARKIEQQKLDEESFGFLKFYMYVCRRRQIVQVKIYNNGESVGMAFTHTAATTTVTGAGVWAVEMELEILITLS